MSQLIISQERLLRTILSPHLSEKSALGTEHKNEYTFEVAVTATKGEIKNAIESLLGAKVKSVRTLNTKGKIKSFRGRKGRRSSWKKAFVTLEAGSKIDLGTE